MNTSLAETYALNEMMRRLKELPTHYEHDPFCSCKDPEKCYNRTKMLIPSAYALQPVKDFQQAVSETAKVNIKKLLKSGQSATAEPLEYMFITINPDTKNVAVGDFISKFEKFIPTKIFSDYCAVIEQRGTIENKLGTGYHCHMLFKRHTPLTKGLPPTNIKQKVRASWKKFTDTANNHLCNIQVLHKTYAYDKLQYMLGHKIKPEKRERVLADRVWRPQQNIKEHYGNSDLVPEPEL